jgi:hypothetical protein
MKNKSNTILYFILITIVTACFMGGCKKDTTVSTSTIKYCDTAHCAYGCDSATQSCFPSPSYKVKTLLLFYPGGIDSNIFSYDIQGRLTSWYLRGMTITFAYAADTVYQYSNGVFKFILNSQGYRIADDRGGHYTYDNSWHPLISVSSSSDSVSNTWSNNDLSTQFSKQGGGTTLITYTYLSTPDKRDIGTSYVGVLSQHLVNTETLSSNGSSELRTHIYQFDTLGRVIVDSMLKSSGYETYRYTYLR